MVALYHVSLMSAINSNCVSRCHALLTSVTRNSHALVFLQMIVRTMRPSRVNNSLMISFQLVEINILVTVTGRRTGTRDALAWNTWRPFKRNFSITHRLFMLERTFSHFLRCDNTVAVCASTADICNRPPRSYELVLPILIHLRKYTV